MTKSLFFFSLISYFVVEQMRYEGADGSTSPLERSSARSADTFFFHPCQQQVGQENTAEPLDQWLALHFFSWQNSWFNRETQTPTWCNLTAFFSLSLSFFKACGLFSRETKQTDELPRQVSQQQTNKTFLLKKKNYKKKLPSFGQRSTVTTTVLTSNAQKLCDTQKKNSNNKILETMRLCSITKCCVSSRKAFTTWPARERVVGSNEVRSSFKQRTRQRRNLSKFLGGPTATDSVSPPLSRAAALRAAGSSRLLTAFGVRRSEPPPRGRPEVHGTGRTPWKWRIRARVF